MLFEVLFRDSFDVAFSTEHISCIPKEAELKSIRAAGYRFRINNKIVDKEKIVKLVADLNKKEWR